MKKNNCVIVLSLIACFLSKADIVEFDELQVNSQLKVMNGGYIDFGGDHIMKHDNYMGSYSFIFDFGGGSYGSSFVVGSGNDLQTYSTRGSFIKLLGDDNVCSGGGGGMASVLGSGNTFHASDKISIVGYGNVILDGGSWSGGFFGNNNSIKEHVGSFPNVYENVYFFGSNLQLTATAPVYGLILMGQYNMGVLNLTDLDAPCFVIGNGTDEEHPSNALVIQKSGRTTITSRGYIPPTIQIPAPVQPETFVVEGSATIKGDLNLTRRQGDIWMGSFGRAEDQGPSN